jgi:hypothetical protein
MTCPTPLEIAAALRSTAEFCRDPDSPKCHGHAAVDEHGNDATASDSVPVAWCAVGWLAKELGTGWRQGMRFACTPFDNDLVPMFDRGDHLGAADLLTAEAERIESTLPTAACARIEEVPA